MSSSNFWYYVIFAIVIIHIVAGFVYVVIRLSPKKGEKQQKNKNK